MATVDEEQRMKFLMRARAKKAQPDNKVEVLSQLEIVDGDKKKKRKTDHGRIRLEIPAKESGPVVAAAVDTGAEAGVKSPPKKKRSLGRKEKGNQDTVELETERHETVAPVAGPAPTMEARTGGSSPWDPLFDPEFFLEKMVNMAGNSSRFNNTPTDKLMRMSLGHELKGLLLNYALAIRQKQEVATTNDKMALVDKNLAFIEREYANTKERIVGEMEALEAKHAEEMSNLTKAHEEKLAKAKEDHVAALKTAKVIQEELIAKEERIASLAKDNEEALSELASLRQEKEKWDSKKESLEDSVGI
jgi:hypothetical protein